jgi:hypothetical protein
MVLPVRSKPTAVRQKRSARFAEALKRHPSAPIRHRPARRDLLPSEPYCGPHGPILEAFSFPQGQPPHRQAFHIPRLALSICHVVRAQRYLHDCDTPHEANFTISKRLPCKRDTREQVASQNVGSGRSIMPLAQAVRRPRLDYPTILAAVAILLGISIISGIIYTYDHRQLTTSEELSAFTQLPTDL